MPGLGLHQPLQREVLGEGGRIVEKVQHDAGAALRRLLERGGPDRIFALPVRRPAPGRVAAGRTRDDIDPGGYHEGGIEADAELADELRAIIGFGGFDPFQERPRAGTGDRAQRFRHLVAAHADAVVLDRELLAVLVGADDDARLGIVGEKLGPGDGLIAKPLAGVGRV